MQLRLHGGLLIVHKTSNLEDQLSVFHSSIEVFLPGVAIWDICISNALPVLCHTRDNSIITLLK
jgi:hypothetical protein